MLQSKAVALRQVPLRVLRGCSQSVSFHQCSIFISILMLLLLQEQTAYHAKIQTKLRSYVKLKCQLDAADYFYCRSYCLLNVFRAPLCLSSGAQEYCADGCCLWYSVLWFSSCRYDGMVWS